MTINATDPFFDLHGAIALLDPVQIRQRAQERGLKYETIAMIWAHRYFHPHRTPCRTIQKTRRRWMKKAFDFLASLRFNREKIEGTSYETKTAVPH